MSLVDTYYLLLEAICKRLNYTVSCLISFSKLLQIEEWGIPKLDSVMLGNEINISSPQVSTTLLIAVCCFVKPALKHCFIAFKIEKMAEVVLSCELNPWIQSPQYTVT